MDIVSKFEKVRVLVAGDVMLDRFWWGDVSRISPEAPVPVVRLNKTTLAAGGAANVAANVAGLGAKPLLLGCVGADLEAEELAGVLANCGIASEDLIRSETRNTTVKTRIIAHGQQVTRVDMETVEPLTDTDEKRILDSFSKLVPLVDAVAISDYAKGFFSDGLLRNFMEMAHAHNIPVVVDPKGRDYHRYRGATVLTPNRREAAMACNLEDTGKAVVRAAGEQLCGELDLAALLVTEGEDGMTLFENGSAPEHFPALAREVFDVTGAGDTVISAIAVSLGAGLSTREAAKIANIAAGFAVERVGTAVVGIEEVAAALAEGSYQAAQ
jgi:D-beta-D-heptose 7-phosphate kinase / D-beta-D-heptose 1-phosphate adenosyltransferase